MILLDIGNTSVTCGRVTGDSISSLRSVLFNDIPETVKKMALSGRSDAVDIVISSVVPEITKKIKKIKVPDKEIRCHVAGENLPAKINHKYKHIKELGMDRRVLIFGAPRLYKGPLLIIDYGTAVTLDYVSARGVFEGGMIIPGPELAFQSLINRAALIPEKIRLPRKAPAFLGRNTQECMSSGILEGYGAMTDELIRRFNKKTRQKLKILVTGGFSRHLGPHIHEKVISDPALALKSLLLLYRDAARKRKA